VRQRPDMFCTLGYDTCISCNSNGLMTANIYTAYGRFDVLRRRNRLHFVLANDEASWLEPLNERPLRGLGEMSSDKVVVVMQ